MAGHQERRGEAALTTLTLGDDRPASSSPTGGDFPRVSRENYEIGGEFARGGGGRLLRARDLRLDRVVAIKEPLALSSHIERRFFREAVLTARLQHPSIVPVHEIGRWPTGQPFYAMKLVSGRSLRDVIAETTTMEERVALVPSVLAVADAVAYAHSERVIHRDVKPSNVMVGAFGETQVIDWGLAKELRTADDGDEEGERLAHARVADETHGIRGTPASMAPEQATGQAGDERTDVYGVGALLYQVLAGGPPYAGDDPVEVTARVVAGPPPPLAERAPRAPLELVAIAERAMARDPAHRYPSAGELADDLRRFLNGQLVRSHRYSVGRRIARFVKRNRRVLLAAVASLAVGTGAALVVGQVRASRAAAPCPSAEGELAGAWDGPRKAQIEAAFRATKLPFADDVLRATERSLDAYASSWARMRQEACLATRVRGTQSSELMDLRMACLTSHLDGLRSLTSRFATPDNTVVEHSVEATAGLPPLAGCANVAALRAPVSMPADPSVKAKIEELQRRIGDTRAARYASRPTDAVPSARDVVAGARDIGFSPLEAEALESEGALLEAAGDLQGAATALREAELAAVAGNDTPVEALAWLELARVTTADGLYPEAESAVNQASACLKRDGNDEERMGLLRVTEGRLLRERGEFGAALAKAEEGLALRERSLPPDDPAIADALSLIGIIQWDQGNYEAALATNARALAMRERTFGPMHPLVAASLGNAGNILRGKGDAEAGLEAERRVLAIDEAVFGRESTVVAHALSNMSVTLNDMGRSAEALDAIDRALAIRKQLLRPDHTDIAIAYGNRALTLLNLKRWDEAIDAAKMRIQIQEGTNGPDFPPLARPLLVIGEALQGKGEPDRAIPPLERALRLASAGKLPPIVVADTRERLALALRDAHGDPSRALELARKARETFAAEGKTRDTARIDGEFAGL
jgi:tetratricopeptide (TPR) repeat protein